MSKAVICIGLSWGGLHALEQILPALPADFGVPIVVTQHRGPDTDRLPERLQRHCRLEVCEALDKLDLTPGRVVLAPPGYHVHVGRRFIEISDEERVNHARPSIDVLFESAAWSHGSRAVGVLMTGNSADGAMGLLQLKQRGALTAVENPLTAEAPVMPRAALALFMPGRVLELAQVGPWIAGLDRAESI